ncbi:DUF3376 domain-containing protein [Streptomyces massasporeus]|uniref:DUF3376 domain-containing protein n=1 Tax=Streptomyces massasporeus TaxID=67324 RepID=UPI00369A19AC
MENNSLPVGHETRLALVLNGGVSLAVWMGGVTHELDLLRQASGDTSEDAVSVPDQAVFRIWKEIAERSGTHVAIDVVAGSSAGGLNGMLLATALGRGASLPNLREVWEESAAVTKLLSPKSTSSALSGESFSTSIKEAVERIGLGSKHASRPVTLFLPATSLDGPPRLYTDGFGNEFSVRDHRRLYQFQNDDHAVTYKQVNGAWQFSPTRRSDFIPANNSVLVQAARATASFPIAFPPVDDSSMIQYRVHPKPAFDDPSGFVIDGGVLNNAPFAPVLKAISRRTLDVPVRRVLVYVVPSAGRREHEMQQLFNEDTPWHKIALNATFYPQEADFRASTDALVDRLSSSVREAHVDLFERASSDPKLCSRLISLAQAQLAEYRRNRARAVMYDLRRRLTDGQTVTSLAVVPEPNNDQIDEILNSSGHPIWVPLNNGAQITASLHSQWRWGFLPAERTLQAFSNHLHGHVMRSNLSEAQQKRLLEGTQFITEQLRDVMAAMEAFEEYTQLQSTPEAVLSDPGTASFIQEHFSRLDIPGVLGQIMNQAATRYVNSLKAANIASWESPQDAVTASLSVEVITRAYVAPSKVVEHLMPEFEFLRLGPDKMSRALFQDQFARMGDRKLYGVRFQHFAAFFSRDWRKNDFTWGRLDAAHHLLRLFTFDNEQQRRSAERRLHEAILAAEAPHGTIPREWMAKNLKELDEGTDNLLLKKVTATKAGMRAFKDATDSIFRLIGLYRLFPIRLMVKSLRNGILRSYIAHPERTMIQATKHAAGGILAFFALLIIETLAIVLYVVWRANMH